MSKPILGVGLGTVLGLFDGLSAMLYSGTGSMLVQIVVGSTLKGLATGLLAGVFARRMRSLPLGVLFGLAVGLVLSYLAAASPDPEGRHYYVEIMLPGAILGLVVGFATQRFGQVEARA